MGKGSNVLSSKPIFRTGNIVCPPSPKVTKPRGDKQDIIAPDPLTTVTSNDMNGFKIAGRESFAAERANARPAAPVWFAETRNGVAVEVNAGKVRRVRTLDDGDEPLTAYRETTDAVAVIKAAAPKPAPKAPRAASTSVERAPLTPEEQAVRDAARAERARQDAQITGYLRSIGYTGKVTNRIKSLALDALAHNATVTAYGATVKGSNKGKHRNG